MSTSPTVTNPRPKQPRSWVFGRLPVGAELPELAGALISHRFGLEDAPAAFTAADERAAGAVKVVVDIR